MRIVIPSVTYADLLAVTLPAWRALCPDAEIVVVTTDRDRDTLAVAAQGGARAVVTDAWTRRVAISNPRENGQGPVFNKALALDEAFGFVPGHNAPPPDGEVCLAVDADVYPCGTLPDLASLRADTVYGCPRYHCETPAILADHLAGRLPRRKLRLMPPRGRMAGERPNHWNSEADARSAAAKVIGYFQLFRARAGLRFGSYWNAGKYDVMFRRQFAARAPLLDVYVLHLGVSDQRNWCGRVVPAWGSAPC